MYLKDVNSSIIMIFYHESFKAWQTQKHTHDFFHIMEIRGFSLGQKYLILYFVVVVVKNIREKSWIIKLYACTKSLILYFVVSFSGKNKK